MFWEWPRGGVEAPPQEAVVWLWIAVPKLILGSQRIASTSRSLREATLSAMGSVHKLLPNFQNLAPNVPSPKSNIAQPDSLPLCSQRSIFTPPTSGIRFGHDRKPAPNICRKQGWIHQLLTSQHQTPDPLQSLSIVLVECAGLVRKAFGHWASLPRFLHYMSLLRENFVRTTNSALRSDALARCLVRDVEKVPRSKKHGCFGEALHAARAVGRCRYSWGLS